MYLFAHEAPFNGSFDGSTDASKAINDALYEQATRGDVEGVILCPGDWKVGKKLNVYAGGALLGTKNGFGSRKYAGPSGVKYGTRLLIESGQEEAAIVIEPESELNGMSMFWPGMNDGKPQPEPYPWAIICNGGNILIQDVELVNPRLGILSWGDTNHFVGITGQPLEVGIEIDGCGNTASVWHCLFEPYQWNRYTPLAHFMNNNAKAFIFRAIDGLDAGGLLALEYGWGFTFDHSALPDWEGMGPNGSLFNCGIDDCGVGVLVRGVSWNINLIGCNLTNGAPTPSRPLRRLLEIDTPDPWSVKLVGGSLAVFATDGEYVVLRRGNLSLHAMGFSGESKVPMIQYDPGASRFLDYGVEWYGAGPNVGYL